jgi:Flp pilus assembly protein TadG
MREAATKSGVRTWRDIRGTAALELGLFLPVLMLFVIYIGELGFSFYQATRVYNASEAGMVYAAKYGYDAAAISAAVVNSTNLSGISANPAPYQFCGCPGATSVATVTCGSTCTGGSTPGTYIRVTATRTRQSIVSVPGLHLPTTLTSTSIIRIN